MNRCGICKRRIWPFPWTRVAFTVRLDGSKSEYHATCFAHIQRVWQEDADRWERVTESWAQKQARLRWEQEDRL